MADVNAICPDAIGLFFEQVAADPCRVAVRTNGICVTYGELGSLVRRYASLFATHESPRVLIALPRGVHAYACMLAAGQAGGFYAAANIASPVQKLQRVAALFDPHVIVAADGLAASLSHAAPAARVVAPSDAAAAPEMAGPGSRDRIAYVTFTSGSTGDPKGVVVPRTGLDHYVSWIRSSGTVRREDVVSQFNSLAFDVSVLDIYGALCSGALLIPVEGKGDRLRPAQVIARESITVWTSVPSAIDLMQLGQQLTAANLRSVRLFTLAGEPLTRAHLNTVFAVCPGAIIQNAYGPTEATVTVSRMAVNAGDYERACLGDAVSIGPAIPGMALDLCGGAHADEGEIVITGPQVALGYWKDAERTQAAFTTAEALGGKHASFHTGDWAERRAGLIFFRGRMDAQVKIRGYRIELEEVAAAIRGCGWPAVCVFKRSDQLVAVVECPPDRVFDEARLRLLLAAELEAYAVPATILAWPGLPRNENDKIDCRLTAALFEERAP